MNQPAQPQMPPCQMRQGPNFAHPLPQGWIVGEEGNHALVLVAPDFSAGIFVFGLSGFMYPMGCDQFAHYVLTQGMRLSPDPRFVKVSPVQPAQGYGQAAAIDGTWGTIAMIVGGYSHYRTLAVVAQNVGGHVHGD